MWDVRARGGSSRRFAWYRAFWNAARSSNVSADYNCASYNYHANVNADSDVNADLGVNVGGAGTTGLNADRPIVTMVNRVIDQRPPFANNNNPPMGADAIVVSTR